MSNGLSPTAICAFNFLAVMAFAAHQLPLEKEEHSLHDLQHACPVVSVSCPAEYKDGDQLTFTATISGGDPRAVPVFSWTVSEGRIVQGQGTSSIRVDLTNVNARGPTGSVTVSGFDSACPATASCSMLIEHWDLSPTKFDSFGALPRNNEAVRLNAYAFQLQNQPGTRAYILAYGGRRGRAGEAGKLAARSRKYLVEARGINAERVVTLDAGYREKLTIDLWIVPTGATPPVAEPTVDPSEVQIIRTGKTKHSRH
jgi:hypothetical protein